MSEPRASFEALIAGKPVSRWKDAMNEIDSALNALGIGQQRDSSGVPRGRLFLPHASCRNAKPRTAEEKKLGVNQDPQCWEHAVDVVSADGTRWVWEDRGGPPYLPVTTSPEPVPVPPIPPTPTPTPIPPVPPVPAPDLSAVRELLAAVLTHLDVLEAQGQVIRTLQDVIAADLDAIQARPWPTYEGRLFGARITLEPKP